MHFSLTNHFLRVEKAREFLLTIRVHSMQVRYSIMQKISRIPLSTMTDINQVSTMIGAAAEVKKHVNSTAQVQTYKHAVFA